MSDRLRWGILGTGNIADQFALDMRDSRRGVIAAVGSRQPESARSFAVSHDIAGTAGSYADVNADRSVDAVYVALPNALHHEWTIRALEAGKHVLCEKPIAANADQCKEMFAVADRAGRVLVEAFMYRSHPQTLAVRERLQAGVIGPVRLIRTSFCFRTRRIAGNVRFRRDLAGGSLMDVGCYCVNLARFLTGEEPSRVHATGRLHETGIDDVVAGTLTFPSGVVSSFVCGMSVQADNAAYVCGSDGYIVIPRPWKPAPTGASFVIERCAPPRMDDPAAPLAPQPAEPITCLADRALYALEADDFAAAVLDGAQPRITAADSLGNMQVLDDLRRQLGLPV